LDVSYGWSLTEISVIDYELMCSA